MDFLITKLELFLISTNLGYNVKKQKQKQKRLLHSFVHFFFFRILFWLRFLQEYCVSLSFTTPGEHSSSLMEITYTSYVQTK